MALSYVVTGGGRGIGRVIAERLSADGQVVVITEQPDVDAQLRGLHPVGRVGLPADVAAVVADLLCDRWEFVNGVTIPVDGGRSVLGQDPEARPVLPGPGQAVDAR